MYVYYITIYIFVIVAVWQVLQCTAACSTAGWAACSSLGTTQGRARILFPRLAAPRPRSECLLSPAIDMSISHNYTEMAITVSCHTLPPLDTDMMNMMRYVHNLIATY